MFLALFAQGLASCGDDDGDNACTPDASRACAGPGMCEGLQTCASDGSGYSPCSCEDGSGGAAGSGGGGGGSSGAAGSGGDAGDPIFETAVRAVGAPCDTDADCPVGPNGENPLICITSTSATEFGTGSPQGGYCTAVCSDEANSADCQAIDGLTICGLLDDATGLGYCIGLCQPGQGAVKCLTDRAQACFAFPMEPTLGACFPVCQSDAACGAGQFCDFGATGLGLCVATQPPGAGIGEACDGTAQGADCLSGTCVTLIDPVSGAPAGSFCSANCTFGLLEGCGFGETEAVGARDAVCLAPQFEGGDGGDLGFCFELCDEDADCAQAATGWSCATFPADIQEAVGRTGECVPPGVPGSDAGVLVDAGN